MTSRMTAVAVLLLLAGCRAQIQHGLDERDANELVTALLAHGFDARKALEKGKKPTWAIELEESQAGQALALLAELKLPRPVRTTTRELATQSSLIETPSVERLRQLEALEGDLEQMLESMEGVHSASVELVVPAPPRPGVPALAANASVLLRVDVVAQERLSQQREAVQRLVAGGVEGLRPEEVALLFDPVAPRSAAPPPVPTVPEPWRYGLGGLALLLCLGAIALIVFQVRSRRPTPASARTTVPAVPAAPSSTARPRIAASVQRKAA